MPYGGVGGCVEQGAREAAEDGVGEDELVELWCSVSVPPHSWADVTPTGKGIRTSAQAHQHHRQHQTCASYCDQEPGAVRIEETSYVDAAEEDEKQLQAEDPSNLLWCVGAELMRAQILLESGCRVYNAEDVEHGTPGAEDDKPARVYQYCLEL